MYLYKQTQKINKIKKKKKEIKLILHIDYSFLIISSL